MSLFRYDLYTVYHNASKNTTDYKNIFNITFSARLHRTNGQKPHYKKMSLVCRLLLCSTQNAAEKLYKRPFKCIVFACRALRKRMGICPPSVRFTPRSAPRVAPAVATTAIKRSVINLRVYLYGHATPKGNDNATNDNGRSVHVAYASRSDEGRRQIRQRRRHYSLQKKPPCRTAYSCCSFAALSLSNTCCILSSTCCLPASVREESAITLPSPTFRNAAMLRTLFLT